MTYTIRTLTAQFNALEAAGKDTEARAVLSRIHDLRATYNCSMDETCDGCFKQGRYCICD